MSAFDHGFSAVAYGRGSVLWGPTLADLRRGTLIGVSALALAAGLSAGAIAADPDRTVVNGEAGAG